MYRAFLVVWAARRKLTWGKRPWPPAISKPARRFAVSCRRAGSRSWGPAFTATTGGFIVRTNARRKARRSTWRMSNPSERGN